jgi:hypothetical protein
VIGHYLNVLTPAQEERALLHEMMPGAFARDNSGARCLRGVVEDARVIWPAHFSKPLCAFRDPVPTMTSWTYRQTDMWSLQKKRHRFSDSGVASRYDALCERFGVVVVNRCIRMRVLNNQAWRLLKKPAVAAG